MYKALCSSSKAAAGMQSGETGTNLYQWGQAAKRKVSLRHTNQSCCRYVGVSLDRVHFSTLQLLCYCFAIALHVPLVSPSGETSFRAEKMPKRICLPMAAARQADVAETLQPSSVKMGEMKKELVHFMHFMQWMCITARRHKILFDLTLWV